VRLTVAFLTIQGTPSPWVDAGHAPCWLWPPSSWLPASTSSGATRRPAATPPTMMVLGNNMDLHKSSEAALSAPAWIVLIEPCSFWNQPMQMHPNWPVTTSHMCNLS
jgi:hypothetical protein